MKIGTIPVLPVADYITIFLYDGKGKKLFVLEFVWYCMSNIFPYNFKILTVVVFLFKISFKALCRPLIHEFTWIRIRFHRIAFLKKRGGGLFSNSNYVLSQGFKCRKVYFLFFKKFVLLYIFFLFPHCLLKKTKKHTSIN